MGNNTKRTTDTHTTKKVTGKHGDEASDNTENAGEPGGSGSGGSGEAHGAQSMDPEFAGLTGELGGVLAHSEKDIQTENQFNSVPGGRKNPNEVHEYIETGAGRVQSTTPVNEPK